MERIAAWLLRLFSRGSSRLADRMQRLEEHNREVKHDLKNVQAHTDYLKALVEGMRHEGDTRRVPRRE